MTLRELDAWIWQHVFGRKILDEAWMIAEALRVWETPPYARMLGCGPQWVEFENPTGV